MADDTRIIARKPNLEPLTAQKKPAKGIKTYKTWTPTEATKQEYEATRIAKKRLPKFSSPLDYFKVYFQFRKLNNGKTRRDNTMRDFREMLIDRGGLQPGESVPSLCVLKQWSMKYKWDLMCQQMHDVTAELSLKLWSVHMECLNFDIKHALQSTAKSILQSSTQIIAHHASKPNGVAVKDLTALLITAGDLLKQSEAFEVNHQVAKAQLIAAEDDEDMMHSVFRIVNEAGVTQENLLKMKANMPKVVIKTMQPPKPTMN